MSKSTPWGPSQGQRTRAPGITFYHTAGHGGYCLSDKRMFELLMKFPQFDTFAGGPWFEEDCDAAVIALAFPQYYSDEEIRGCVRSVQCSKRYGGSWPAVNDWLDNDPEGKRLVEIADEFERSRAGMWERGGMSAGGFIPEYSGYWNVHVYRGGCTAGAEMRAVMMPGYPEKNWYTDEEIAQFEAFDAEKHYRPRKPMAAALMPTLVGASCGEDECHSDADPGL